MANRAERRRQARAHGREPVLMVGDNVVAAALGSHYEAKPHAQLPDKEPGQHRWIAAAMWAVPQDLALKAFDPDEMKFLDHENLINLSFGCYDCEQVLGGQGAEAGSVCPGVARG